MSNVRVIPLAASRDVAGPAPFRFLPTQVPWALHHLPAWHPQRLRLPHDFQRGQLPQCLLGHPRDRNVCSVQML